MIVCACTPAPRRSAQSAGLGLRRGEPIKLHALQDPIPNLSLSLRAQAGRVWVPVGGPAGVKGARMIDWDRVSDLRAEIGASGFEEVAEMFLAEAEEVTARLRAGRPDPTLESDLHFLKGAALNLGFTELAALCGAGEKLAAAHVPVDVGMVADSFDASRRAFEAGLNSRAA